MVNVLLAQGLICFLGTCHPALVGERTPTGQFTLQVLPLDDPRFGGDVLVFAPDGPRAVFAVHRAPTVNRRELLRRPHRRPVTAGCINVTDEVYDRLRNCCVEHTMLIQQ